MCIFFIFLEFLVVLNVFKEFLWRRVFWEFRMRFIIFEFLALVVVRDRWRADR